MSYAGKYITNSGGGGFIQTINGAVPLAGNINLTSNGATILITPGVNTVNLEVAGGSGVASVTAGSNINLTGTATNPIINLNNSPSVSGTLTAVGNITSTTGNINSTLGQLNSGTSVNAGTSINATTSIGAGTTITAGTGISSTSGNIVAVAGNINAPAGNVNALTSVTVGGANTTAGLYVNSARRIGAWITGSPASTGADTDGIFVDSSFTPSANVANAASIGLYPTFTPPVGVTIATGYGLYIAAGTSGGAGSTTTGYGLYVTHPAFGTTNYAAQIDNMRLDVNSIVATNANGTLTLNSDGSGALNLNTTNATGAVNIGLGTSGRTINIGLSAANNSVFLGTSNGSSATNIQAGSGNLILNSTGGTASLDATSGVAINSTAGTLALGDGANSFAVNVGTAGTRTVTVGSATSTSNTLIRGGTGASSFQPTTTGTLDLGTTSTGAVSLGNTTGTTTIQFGTGSALSTYNAWTSWTPTLDGSVSGTTTYTAQIGQYSRIGNIVVVHFQIAITAATGTGNLTIGNLPFTVSNTIAINPVGSITISGPIAWPAAATQLVLAGIQNTTTCLIRGIGTTLTSANLQMANAAYSMTGTLIYRV